MEKLSKEPSTSTYLYPKEITLYSNFNYPVDKYLKNVTEIYDTYLPTIILLSLEPKNKSGICWLHILGMKQTKEEIFSYLESCIYNTQKSNIKYSITFYYSKEIFNTKQDIELVNILTLDGNIINKIVLEAPQYSYNLKRIATILNINGIPQLDNIETISVKEINNNNINMFTIKNNWKK